MIPFFFFTWKTVFWWRIFLLFFFFGWPQPVEDFNSVKYMFSFLWHDYVELNHLISSKNHSILILLMQPSLITKTPC